MHIPDGYLSPSTCAGLYGGSIPFWSIALNRVKRELNTRTIPLLSLFSAFSFVVMMFNLPLPGGTTGHAVGMGISSIILGPWVSIIAISIALLIQALLFGDGGVTAFGANCFNMAIVGSLVAFFCYRLISRGAAIDSSRRVFAAGFAGYAAINVAALCAAIEFGVQPLLFHDASGSPLYAPYPLSISIPAMMIGHLTFAGLAELILTAGLVRYFQSADPEILRRTAPHAPSPKFSGELGLHRPAFRSLWIGLATIVLLSPRGIVAVGNAWGEWSVKDLSDPSTQSQIASVSAHQPLPSQVPKGLERLSSIWKAPVSDYAPSFLKNRQFGYLVSATFGVGFIALVCLFATRLLIRSRRSVSFVEKTARSLLAAFDEAIFAEDIARSPGLLQALDPRVKLVGISTLLLTAIAVHRLPVLLLLFAASITLAILSRVSLRFLSRRVWLAVLAFTGVIALPAIFLVPGNSVFAIPGLGWTVTYQGLTSAILLLLRAETAATLSCLLIVCTRWNQLLSALRFFSVPVVVVVILQSTYRFIFLLLQSAEAMFESRQTRAVGSLSPSEERRFAVATAGVLLDKSLALSSKVHEAMQARGYRGEPKLIDEVRMVGSDWTQLAAFLSFAGLTLFLGR